MEFYEEQAYEEEERKCDKVSVVTWCCVSAVASAAVVFTLAGFFKQVLGFYVICCSLWAFVDSFDRGCWTGFIQLVVGAVGVIIGAILIGWLQ